MVRMLLAPTTITSVTIVVAIVNGFVIKRGQAHLAQDNDKLALLMV
jgi:hypothetical protein